MFRRRASQSDRAVNHRLVSPAPPFTLSRSGARKTLASPRPPPPQTAPCMSPLRPGTASRDVLSLPPVRPGVLFGARRGLENHAGARGHAATTIRRRPIFCVKFFILFVSHETLPGVLPSQLSKLRLMAPPCELHL